MEFISINFYANENLDKGKGNFGHWSNMQTLNRPFRNGKLFGSHAFPLKRHRFLPLKKIYIFRDGLDVAFSLWKSNFYNKDWGDISFYDFLQRDLDWYSTPTHKFDYKGTVLKHWAKHVEQWHQIQNPFILIVRFEELLNTPERISTRIAKFLNVYPPSDLKKVTTLVGLSPNHGKIKEWKTHLHDDQIEEVLYKLGKAKRFLWTQRSES